jgi:hypothetical protein
MEANANAVSRDGLTILVQRFVSPLGNGLHCRAVEGTGRLRLDDDGIGYLSVRGDRELQDDEVGGGRSYDRVAQRVRVDADERYHVGFAGTGERPTCGEE